MGCVFVVGGIDKERERERSTRGKAVEENNRKADFMLGGLHLIFSQRGGTVCGPAYGLTATWWSVTALRSSGKLTGTEAVIRVNIRRLGQSRRSKLDLLSRADGVM